MAASGVCAGGLEALSGSLAGPSPSNSLQSRTRRSSWHGDMHGPGREERQRGGGGHQHLRSSFVGPNLPTPERGSRSRRTSTGEVLLMPDGGQGRRMSTGGVRAEASREAVVAPQVDAERPVPNGFVVGREMEGESQGILDGMDEQLPVRTDLSMVVGVHVCPHADKIEKGGEDAYFVSMTGGGVIGVADGVSGVAEDGIDPALYSKELMKLAQEAADGLPAASVTEDPRSVLEAAHKGVQAQGACTAVVAALESGSGKLRVANLGDSGLRVLRRGRICFATPALQHFFDCPYQFGSESTDSVADAEAFEVQLEAGDTLVMGSDGLFDNMFDRDLEAVVSLFNDTPEAAGTTAVALANLAKKHSVDVEYESPYILEAIKEGYDVPFWKKMLGQKLTGGKKDDITVVVANIVVREKNELEEVETDIVERDASLQGEAVSALVKEAAAEGSDSEPQTESGPQQGDAT